jgi:photosystem II stability/assembly factor-like uncharacterized protein
MNKNTSILFALTILLLGLAACNPVPVPPTPTLEPTIIFTETSLPTNTVQLPTEAPTVPTETVTATTPPGVPIPHLPAGSKVVISSIHMITATNGWGIGRGENELTDHVLHTSDGGKTWRDLTPPENIDVTVGHAALAFFMDDQTAWVAYSLAQAYPYSGNAVIWFTHDGGATWNSSSLDLSGIADYYSPGEISFSNNQHGWLLVHVGAGMMHDYVMLYSTIDGGGQTWSRLADPYNNGTFPMICCKNGMVFTDSQHGWLTGDTHAVEPGIFFYQTSDAGVSWTEVNLPGPTENPGIFSNQTFGCGTYSPSFIDAQHGSLLVECSNYNDMNNKPTWLYTTDDGGTTWISHAMPAMTGQIQMIDASNGYYISGKIFKTTNGGKSWSTVIPVTWEGSPDFIDINNGWIVARKDSDVALVQTTNAAVNWTIINTTIAP